jgi:pyruvate dehydrogenase E1 component beta subunit
MEMTYRDAIRAALREEMIRDERVLMLGEDIGAYGGSYAVTKGFLDEFGPARIRETPIAEAGIVGLGIGAALGGLRPVPELMTINFSLLAMDQIVNNAAKFRYMFGGQMSVPIVIRTASGWGQLGPTHSQSFEAYFAHVPGLQVVMAATPADAKGLLKSAVRSDDPVVFIEHANIYGVKGEVPDDEDYLVPIGSSSVVREGTDLTMVTYSRSLYTCLAAADRLAREDEVSCTIVDLRTLRPLDLEPALRSIARTNHALVVSEDWKTLGVTSEVAARLAAEAFDNLDAPVGRVALKEVPMPYSRNLEHAVVPDEGTVVAAARKVLG